MTTHVSLRILGAAVAVGMLSAHVALAEDKELVIGTSAVLGGPVAQFGGATRDAYEFAAQQINEKGGINVGGTNYKIKLVVLDNQGDPNQVSGQARKLVLNEGAIALVGAVTPVFNGALSAAADQLKVPFVTSNLPVLAWQAGRPEGYKYAWDIYAYEPDAAKVTWKSIDLVETNKKAAIFANTNDDGDAWTKYWTESAAEFGYQIVYVANMPIGTTNFGEYVNAAKQAGAEIVLGQLVPPDGIALWKQMKALDFHPKVSTCELCGSGDWWPGALGPLAQGTLTTDIWKEGIGGPGEAEVVKALGEKHKGKVLASVMGAHSAFNVLIDAIVSAGSLDPDAINEAIGKTDKLYSVGHVQFTLGHAAPLNSVMKQWQDGNLVGVWPQDKNSVPILFPMPGLQ